MGEQRRRVYWRRLGEVMHYMADYFTFPHNRNFTGNLYEHNKYEKHLKNHLKTIYRKRCCEKYGPVHACMHFGSFSGAGRSIFKGCHANVIF